VKGRGVIATRPFVKGQFVMEYGGQLLDAKRAKNKEQMYEQDSDIGCFMFYFEHRGRKLWCVS